VVLGFVLASYHHVRLMLQLQVAGFSNVLLISYKTMQHRIPEGSNPHARFMLVLT
jgi:hypothetical protein